MQLPAYQYPDGSNPYEAVVEIHNYEMRLWNVPPPVQQLIIAACSYPTDQALEATVWRPPGMELGDTGWDGWVRLARWPRNGPGTVPTGLLPIVHRVLTGSGYPFRLEERRVRPDEGVPDRPALPLYDYQREAVKHAVRLGRGVLDMPPRSGKTMTAIEIVRQLWLPTLWIAPTTNIISQTVRAFDAQLGKNFAVQLVGSAGWREKANALAVCCTAATAAALPAEFFQTRQVLVIDEVHHGASPQYHHIGKMAHHIYFRYGLTGTFGRSSKKIRDADGKMFDISDDLALHALLSTVIYKVETQQLVLAKRLVPTCVAILPIYVPRLKDVGGTYSTGSGKYGIWEHDYRNQLVAWAAATLHARRLRTLVLVATKEQGERIAQAITEMVGNHAGKRRTFNKVEFVSGARPASVCQEIIDSFGSSDGCVEVLVGTTLVGEGTDIPECDALVYARGERAEISHRQAMFRVATALPHKKVAYIIDFDDQHHRTLAAHAAARAETYRSEPTATVYHLDTVEDLPLWADWIARSRVHYR